MRGGYLENLAKGSGTGEGTILFVAVKIEKKDHLKSVIVCFQ
jgi:hypothetical protein